jgi:hypothetical protein
MNSTFCTEIQMRIKKQGVQHSFDKNSVGKYMCPYECQYCTVNESTMSMHISRKHGEEAGRQTNFFSCTSCDNKFNTGTALAHHIKAAHTLASIPCKDPCCKLIFKMEQSLCTHYVRKHMNEQSLIRYTVADGSTAECLHCKKEMKTSSITYHLAKCVPDSPFSKEFQEEAGTFKPKVVIKRKLLIVDDDSDEDKEQVKELEQLTQKREKDEEKEDKKNAEKKAEKEAKEVAKILLTLKKEATIFAKKKAKELAKEVAKQERLEQKESIKYAKLCQKVTKRSISIKKPRTRINKYRDMSRYFKQDQEIRHVFNDKEWIGIYDEKTNSIMYNKTSYKYLSNFAKAHYLVDRPNQCPEANGWVECEYKVDDTWQKIISLD